MSENINEANWNLVKQYTKSNGNLILLDNDEFPNLIVKRTTADGKLNIAVAVKAYKAANDYPCGLVFGSMLASVDPFEGWWHDQMIRDDMYDGRQLLFASDEELDKELKSICDDLLLSEENVEDLKELTRTMYAAIDAFIPGVEWVGPINSYFKQDFGAIPAPVRDLSQLDAEER